MVFFKNLQFLKDYADFAIRVQASDSRQFDVRVVFFTRGYIIRFHLCNANRKLLLSWDGETL